MSDNYYNGLLKNNHDWVVKKLEGDSAFFGKNG
jgi:hypothetical protein